MHFGITRQSEMLEIDKNLKSAFKSHKKDLKWACHKAKLDSC